MLVWLLVQYIYILTHYIDSSNRGQSSWSSYVINHTVVPSYHLVFLFWLKTFQIRWSHFAIWEVWTPIDEISFFILERWGPTVYSFYCLVDWILKREQSWDRVRVLKKSRDSTNASRVPSGKPCEFGYLPGTFQTKLQRTFLLVSV